MHLKYQLRILVYFYFKYASRLLKPPKRPFWQVDLYV